MIAVPSEDSLSWISVKNCMWRAPKCLTGITALSRDYGLAESLFTGALEIQSATAYDIAEHLDANADNPSVMESTKALLLALSDLIPGQETLGGFPLEQLRRIQIFPVRQLNGSLALAAADDETWYIADDQRHHKYFQGKLALLDFTPLQIPQLMSLLKLLSIARRVLSGSVVEEMAIKGKSKLHPGLSAELQSKAKYIAL